MKPGARCCFGFTNSLIPLACFIFFLFTVYSCFPCVFMALHSITDGSCNQRMMNRLRNTSFKSFFPLKCCSSSPLAPSETEIQSLHSHVSSAPPLGLPFLSATSPNPELTRRLKNGLRIRGHFFDNVWRCSIIQAHRQVRGAEQVINTGTNR